MLEEGLLIPWLLSDGAKPVQDCHGKWQNHDAGCLDISP